MLYITCTCILYSTVHVLLVCYLYIANSAKCTLGIFTFLAVLYKSKDIILQFFINISSSLLSLFPDDGA